MENNYDLPSGDRIWELASEAKAGRDKSGGRSKQKRKAINGQAKKKQTKSQNE